jgi:hypothetical protein
MTACGQTWPKAGYWPSQNRAGRVGGLTKTTVVPVFHSGVFLLIYIFLLTGCGIEDYPYLYPVPQGNITREFNTQATVYITDANDGNPFFYNYAIYYRIYLSGISESSPSTGNFSAINPTLAQDYSVIAAYINSTTTGNTSIGTLFQNRNYNALELSNGSLENLLREGSGSHSIVFEFHQNPDPAQPWPYLTIDNGGPYYLYRSTGNGRFNPMPQQTRYFMKYQDLINPVYINQTYSADVVNKQSGTETHAYAAFFIVAVGLDTITFSSIYSTPAFVGVLRLPDP